MPNVLKPFGEKATASLRNAFHGARVRLTFIYVVILLAVLFISSSSIYSAFSRQLEHRFERFRPRPPVVLPEGMIPPSPEEVRADLINALLVVNGFLLLVGGVLSYYLAGVTLEPIERAYDKQRRFLSDASHELRTPLAILQTDLENALRQDDLLRATREQAQSYLEEVKRMGRLVNDLLLLSRFDEENVTVQTSSTINVPDVVQTAVTRLQGIAKEKNVFLDLSHRPGEALKVKANADLLLQALTNVIHNAIVYNASGGHVTVVTSVEGHHVRVVITDTGVGIAADDLEKIFERFYRADKSRSRQTGGSGLGLSIVQTLIEQMDGSVDIQSTPGKGTTVIMFLPLASAS